jgi:hypothetical protein
MFKISFGLICEGSQSRGNAATVRQTWGKRKALSLDRKEELQTAKIEAVERQSAGGDEGVGLVGVDRKCYGSSFQD